MIMEQNREPESFQKLGGKEERRIIWMMATQENLMEACFRISVVCIKHVIPKIWCQKKFWFFFPSFLRFIGLVSNPRFSFRHFVSMGIFFGENFPIFRSIRHLWWNDLISLDLSSLERFRKPYSSSFFLLRSFLSFSL